MEILHFQKINEAVQKASNILLISHRWPDGDSIGAVLAFSFWLQSLQKTYTAYCATPITRMFSFVPGKDLFINDNAFVLTQKYDLIMVFDSSDLEFAGIDELFHAFLYQPTVINIDHHESNTRFGDINIIDPAAASTSEIVYNFLSFNLADITPDMATNLLLGIISDTNNFTNPATTSSAIGASAKLMNLGANYKAVNTFMRQKSVTTLKFWGRILSRLQKNNTLGFVSTVIQLNDFQELGVSEEDCVAIVNFLNSLDDAKAVLVLREKENGTLKGSFRTTNELINVEKIAKLIGVHGGGGHKKAAGFSLPGIIKQTEAGWMVI